MPREKLHARMGFRVLPRYDKEMSSSFDAASEQAGLLTREIARRRTFAIISHPDAGKTTLTEKLLLYAGAIELAHRRYRWHRAREGIRGHRPGFVAGP